MELLLRSFDNDQLKEFAVTLSQLSDQVLDEFPGIKVDLEIRQQYRNLRDGLIDLPEAIELPCKAFEQLGRPVQRAIIRGGTDGSQLTEKGLPTPNLSSGQYQIHSVREFACLDQMIEAIEHLQVLLKLWSQEDAKH